MQIPLSSPDITVKEMEAVLQVLQSGCLALGPKMAGFEDSFCRRLGVKHAVAVNSGTSGLHLLIRSYNIGEGDEVITSPFSFIASANCLLYEQARPVFADIDPDSLNLDPALIEAAVTPRTKAILPVHAFGHPAEMEQIRAIAVRFGLKVIEDACEAVGAALRGRAAGTFGDGAVFAFYPNKQITTGEGGMIVTDDDEVARLCRSMRNQGRSEEGGWLDHRRLGYNYRMDEMSAALGLVQMERLQEILEKRAQVAEKYNFLLREVEGVRVPFVSAGVDMSWFVYVIRLDSEIDRDGVLKYLQACGVQCKPYFTPIHLQPFYREQFGYREGCYPVTEAVSRSVVALPFYNNLGPDQIDYVVEKLIAAVGKFRAR